MSKNWSYITPGIPDDNFIRDQVPLTKEEIRALTLAKARLAPGQVIWDIGAGTGSIAVEAALLVPDGAVYAIEKNKLAQQLIQKNAYFFNTANLTMIAGEAPGALMNLPKPDRVIIGGSGGNLAQIFQIAYDKLNPGGRIIANTVTVQSFAQCASLFAIDNWQVVQVNIAKSKQVGNYHMWQSLNTVYIFTLEKKKDV